LYLNDNKKDGGEEIKKYMSRTREEEPIILNNDIV